MLFQQDDQQREKREMLLKAYEGLRQAGERITVENLMNLVQGKGMTQQEVRSCVEKLRRGRAM